MTPNTLIRRNPDLIAADMDGETVMMDMHSGNYYGMNAVGSYIWTLLETEQRLDKLIAAVMAHFDIHASDEVADDIQVFLTAMQAQKLVNVIPS